jgi:hypothetical protein
LLSHQTFNANIILANQLLKSFEEIRTADNSSNVEGERTDEMFRLFGERKRRVMTCFYTRFLSRCSAVSAVSTGEDIWGSGERVDRMVSQQEWLSDVIALCGHMHIRKC